MPNPQAKGQITLQITLKKSFLNVRTKRGLTLIALALLLKLAMASLLWQQMAALLPYLAAAWLAKVLLVPMVVIIVMNKVRSRVSDQEKVDPKKLVQQTALTDPIMDDDFDFLQNPYPVFEQYRAQGPVVWSARGNHWIVTGYEEGNQLLRDNGFGKRMERWKHPNIFARLFFRFMRKVNVGNILFQDPPQHTRVRSLVQGAFVPATVRALDAKIQKITDEYLDGIAPGERGDLLAQLAFPLPVTVIAELLGIPAAKRDQFKIWSTEIISSLRGNVCPYRAMKSFKASRELRAYLRKIAREKADNPQNDLLSALVKIQNEEGGRLSEGELLSNSILILIAGHETTVNLIGNGIYQLLKNPDQKALLVKNPQLLDAAVDEMLRLDPPVQLVRRLAYKDLTIAGKTIQKGEAITILISACNRDPAIFANPEKFDIERERIKNMSFGAGIHYCLGAELARSEARHAISTVLKKYPGIQLQNEKLTYRTPFALRGLTALPVIYSFLIIGFACLMQLFLCQSAFAQQTLQANVVTEVQLKPPPSEVDMTGLWKAHVFEVERHPNVTITNCSDKQVQGIFKGQMGKFPLTGTYDAITGKVRLEINFSSSRLVRLRGLSSATAVVDGQINGAKMVGTATFPEFKDKVFRWEAVQTQSDSLR